MTVLVWLRAAVIPIGLVTLAATAGASQDRRPNVVLIMADDLGYGDLGCYGQREIRTPRIDRLAAEGLRLTHCYSGSTVCAPSRCSLLTGRHTGHARIRGNGGWVGPPELRVRESELPLQDGDVTIAEVLKGVGYATGACGKWGVGRPGSTGLPTRQGFSQFLGFLNQLHAHTYYPEYLWGNETMLSLDRNLGGWNRDWVHDRFTRFAIDFITEHQAEPFFLYVAYTVPHGRYEIPDDSPYGDRDWPQPIRDYAAMVTRMDRDVGKILDRLDQLGLDDRTLVLFTSDNGPEIYYFEKTGLVDDYDRILGSRGGLTGWKRDLTDGGIRVPMIVRWPGQIAAGTESDRPCALYDLLPTIAELAGAAVPPGVDGLSLVPTLRGRQQPPAEYLYWEFFERGFQQAVRHGDYKALRLSEGGPLQLFDIVDDPTESHDLASERPEVAARIESYLDSARSPSENWPR